MKYFLLLCFLTSIYSCKQASTPAGTNAANKDSLKQQLINTDKSWCDASMKSGYYHSRNQFCSDASIELSQNEMPLVGKQAIADYSASHPDTGFTLQWAPIKAEVAASGEIGYTYGSWMMKRKTKLGADTTTYGVYMTVWQKQPDGSWKFIVDGGNDTPKEVEK